MDEDLELGNRTVTRVTTSVKKVGFREGSAAGHDETFQKGFDLGYSNGYTAGEIMGYLNGILRVIEEREDLRDTLSSSDVSSFELPFRGACILCPNKKVFTKEEAVSSMETSKSLKEIINNHNLVINSLECEKDEALKKVEIILGLNGSGVITS